MAPNFKSGQIMTSSQFMVKTISCQTDSINHFIQVIIAKMVDYQSTRLSH